jgi:hypothetical protein
MDIRIRELHYRWIETPCEAIAVDEVPSPEPPPHPQPNDPPPTAVHAERGDHSRRLAPNVRTRRRTLR